MSESKPNWAEKTSAVSNVLQNVQLQELHSTLRATGALQAEKLQLELNEQQVKDREDRLREHIWQMEQNFERLLNNPEVTPSTRFIFAKQIQGDLAQFNVTTASFRQFADKDRFGQFFNRLQQVAEDSQNKMSGNQKADTETYLRYQSEAQSLEDAITDQQATKRHQGDLRDKLKECRQQKAQSAEELEHLNQSFVTQKQAEAAERPRPIRHAIKIVFAVQLGFSAVGCGLAAIYLLLVLGEFWEAVGLAVLALILAVIISVMFPQRKSEIIGEQIKALEAKIKEKEAEISSLESQITACGEDREGTDLPALLKQKQEHEAFMLQFRQANDLPLEDSLSQKVTAVGQASRTALSLEVQELARHADKKIAAIKLHREQTGVSLGEAKAEVEDFAMGRNNSA